MKKTAILLCILCATIVFADKWHQRADLYWNKGQSFKRQKDYKRAITSFTNAARAERKSNNVRVLDFIKQIQEISNLYIKMKDYKNGRKYFRAMYKIAGRYKRPLYQGIALQGAAVASINLEKNQEAVKYLNRALTFFKKVKSFDRQIIVYNSLGRAYRQNRQFKKSLYAYKMALKKSEEIGLRRNKAAVLSNIGVLYFHMKDYSGSLKYQNRALDIDRKFGIKSDLSTDLSNISQVYLQLGRFGEAVNYLQQSLVIEKELKNNEKIAARYNSLGEIYFRLGQDDKALRYYKKSLEVNKFLKLRKNQAILLHKIGVIYEQKLERERALNYYVRALSLDKSLKTKSNIKRNLSDIGTIYERRGRYDEALDAFDESRKNKEYVKQRMIAADLINIGRMHITLKQYTKALKPLIEAERNARKYNIFSVKVDAFYFKGIVYLYKLKYTESISNLKKAENLLTKVKKNNLNLLYRLHDVQSWLIVSLYEKKSIGEMLVTANKMMKYKLNYGLNYKTGDVSLPKVQNVLTKDDAYVIYPVMCSELPVAILILQNRVYVRKLEVNSFLTHLNKKTASRIYKHRLKIDELSKVNFKRSKRPKGIFYDLQDVVNYYRSLHMKKNITKDDIDEITFLGKKLYKLLIQPIDIFIQGKKNLLIRPDCILSTLPFGTLKNGNDNYLGRLYKLSFSVSSTRFTSIKPVENKGFNTLLIGNPVAESVKYKMSFKKSNRYMDMMTEKACLAISGNNSIEGVIKLCSSSLPGKIKYASKELVYLNNLIKGSTMIQQRNATESYIKRISSMGTLKNFNLIYISVKGIIVPEVPELSSLLFSRGLSINTKNDDGYLNLKEISSLKMNCRLLWLSYVDLPQGRINMRNGVGKLVESFHRGGAAGVVIPLWKVEDSFRVFISSSVYDMAKMYSLSFNEALHLVKRIILTSDYSLDRKNIVKKHLKGLNIDSINRFKSPYYWSAYQYYGR